MKKTLPIDNYLETGHLPLQERISARRSAEFQAGHKKFSTKDEMGEISTDLRRLENPDNKLPKMSELGADGLAMLYDIY